MSHAWTVFEYEKEMAIQLWETLTSPGYDSLSGCLQNATVECLALHTRILADMVVARSNQPDDMTINHLLPGFTSHAIPALLAVYGTTKSPGSPCSQFNQMIAHPSLHRADSHDYMPALKAVWRHLSVVLDEIEQARPSTALQGEGRYERCTV